MRTVKLARDVDCAVCGLAPPLIRGGGEGFRV
jgi:hypothetical protein